MSPAGVWCHRSPAINQCRGGLGSASIFLHRVPNRSTISNKQTNCCVRRVRERKKEREKEREREREREEPQLEIDVVDVVDVVDIVDVVDVVVIVDVVDDVDDGGGGSDDPVILTDRVEDGLVPPMRGLQWRLVPHP